MISGIEIFIVIKNRTGCLMYIGGPLVYEQAYRAYHTIYLRGGFLCEV